VLLDGLFHFDGLLQIQIVAVALGADGCGGEPEVVAEGSGKGYAEAARAQVAD